MSDSKGKDKFWESVANLVDVVAAKLDKAGDILIEEAMQQAAPSADDLAEQMTREMPIVSPEGPSPYPPRPKKQRKRR